MGTSSRPGWLSATVATWVGAVLLFAVAAPLVVALDGRLDRVRPMHRDRVEMLWLQHQSVLLTGRSVPGDVPVGGSVEVAGETFTASAGVSVEVRSEDATRPCVRARNQDGDVTEWACLDPDDPPVDPDPEDPDLGVG